MALTTRMAAALLATAKHAAWQARAAAREANGWAKEYRARRDWRYGSIDTLSARFAADAGGAVAFARAWRADLGRRALIHPDERVARLAALRAVSPRIATLLLSDARRAASHDLTLLGCAPSRLGGRLDWHGDPRTGHRWPAQRWHRRLRAAAHPGGPDVKMPWELSRLQHVLRLAQAWWISEDPCHVDAGLADLNDWIDSNPVGLGINWVCPMEVAIRAVNMSLFVAMALDARSMDGAQLARVAASLAQHGHFVREHLEGAPDRTTNSNHYVANLVGLSVIGLHVPPIVREREEWLALGTRELWHELAKQVLPDGADYEGSIPYHRLVLEMILVGVLAARKAGQAVPPPAWSRVLRMAEFTATYTKPDGSAPSVGDQDNGRLLRLEVFADPAREWIDHRSLLSVVAGLSDSGTAPATTLVCGDAAQTACWLLPVDSLPAVIHRSTTAEPCSPSRSFPFAGIHVLRSADRYVLATGGASGTGGLGGHSHNDLLGFELAFGEDTLVVDPGTGVYTADYDLRNRLRSVRSHSTIMIDGREQAPMDPQQLFTLRGKPAAALLDWNSGGDEESATLAHEQAGVRVVRCFRLPREADKMIVGDEVTGQGKHTLESRFMLALDPAEVSSHGGQARLLFVSKRARYELRISSNPPMAFMLQNYELSPSYGVVETRKALVGRVSCVLPWSSELQITRLS